MCSYRNGFLFASFSDWMEHIFKFNEINMKVISHPSQFFMLSLTYGIFNDNLLLLHNHLMLSCQIGFTLSNLFLSFIDLLLNDILVLNLLRKRRDNIQVVHI